MASIKVASITMGLSFDQRKNTAIVWSVLSLTEEGKMKVVELQKLLDNHKNQRVVVVGTTGTGKSTLLKQIKNAHDQDELVFPKLTQEEAEYVCQTPWTEEIGRAMERLVKQYVVIKPGEPVFGTVVLPCDLIVYLKISDELLRERVAARSNSFDDAKNMQRRIEEEIQQSGIPTIDFFV